jgi:glycosyltransferase involved in cell wall biosynthesis
MRILITNIGLDVRCGTTLYVRDLALELLRAGHEPTVYTRSRGDVAREVENSGIPVVGRLRSIRAAPDVIHGHHSSPTRDALRRFPRTPAIFVCHDHTSFFDRPVFGPQLRRYFGVSNLCIERLIRDGVDPQRAQLLTNFVDTRRFVPRGRLPPQPLRALVFSNYANKSTHLPAVADACRQAGLQLDVIGESAGNVVASPEAVLGHYDIVFAKSRAAMEAMASGVAVVLCDFGGVGPAVTTGNFESLRPLNFGFQALAGPLTAKAVLEQISVYDCEDAARVSARLRSVAGLEKAVQNLCDIYAQIASEAGRPPSAASSTTQSHSFNSRGRVRTAVHHVWLKIPPSGRKLLKHVPGVRALIPKLRDRRI